MSLSHKKLASFYLQLAQLLDAGLPLAAALRGSTSGPRSGTEAFARWIEAGGSIEQGLHAASGWLPKTDRPFLAAAAISGRLPLTLRNLAERHTEFNSTQLRLVLTCAYPLGVLHLGLLIFPIINMIDWQKGIQWSLSSYLLSLALTLLPLWGGAWYLYRLHRRQSPALDRFLGLLPLLRTYRRAQALADFAFALGNLLDAGVLIGQAWATAGKIARWPALRTAGRKVHEIILRGEAPGLHLHEFPCFPIDFVALYRAGELAGQLDQNLKLLAAQNQEQARHHLKLAAGVYATALFLVIAGVVVYSVIRFYVGYFNMLDAISAM